MIRQLLIVPVISFLLAGSTIAQLTSVSGADTVAAIRGLLYGVDKIANTFVFHGNADIGIDVLGGRIAWQNVYRGSAFRTATTAVRDDNISALAYFVPITDGMSVVLRQAYNLSRDSRSIGISSMERITGTAGIRWSPSPTTSAEINQGVDATTQIGQSATGYLGDVLLRTREILLGDWEGAGRMYGALNRLDDRRTNADVDIGVDVSRSLDDGTNFSLSMQGNLLRRDFFTSLASLPEESVVESRSEERMSISLGILLPLAVDLDFTGRGTFTATGIDRRFGNAYQGVEITSVNRRLSEANADFDVNLRYSAERLRSNLTFGINSREEANGVVPVFDITDEGISAIRRQEQQRDNLGIRTRIATQHSYNATDTDTISAEASWSMFRYDTPSTLNHDDRDEATTSIKIGYGKRASDLLSMGVSVIASQVHLVFLRAQRSAFNNLNTVLRFAPYVTINAGIVRMMPQLEVLANYTVYDFESAGLTARSYSFRQLSLRDTIQIQLNERLEIQGKILYRYFERAALYWDTFAESPENSNKEILTKVMLFMRQGEHLQVGAGVRYYELRQQMLAGSGGGTAAGAIKFFAPEAAVYYTSAGGSRLQLNGWYEFQHVNIIERRSLPNLMMSVWVAM